MLPAHHGPLVARALEALGIESLVLAIHDACFPGDPGDDAGRGSPPSKGGARLLAFARALGFGGVQLGPSGQTSATNLSPYDGTIFSRNVLSIDLRALTEPGPFGALLDPETLAEIAENRPRSNTRVHYRYAFDAQRRALAEVFARYSEQRPPDLVARVHRFAEEHRDWLEREVLYDALCEEHGEPYFRHWMDGGKKHPDQELFQATDPEGEPARLARRRALLEKYRDRFEAHALFQLIAHEQHAAMKERAEDLGLALYGDLQIGHSAHDTWAYGSHFLRGYLMGAPPSRTNPEGQPWGYPVLDPGLYEAPDGERGPVVRLLAARMDKMFAEFDGVRIDHPHGLVCPWVYRGNTSDPHESVRSGARLFSSPDLPDHPDLARFSIVKPAAIQRDRARHADDWIARLTDAEVERYNLLFEVVCASARKHGRSKSRLVCEVLSTMPLPLRRVLEHHGLGRFRVVQKASLDDPADVYRTENARPEDWVMLGTHDTKPAFLVAQQWMQDGKGARWAAHLGARLGSGREAIERGGAGALVHAMFADLCASEARNVMVFFSDLFGLTEIYNVPGTVNDENWTLRLGPHFERCYLEKVARGEALNLPRALALALRARDPRSSLADELERLAGELESIGKMISPGAPSSR